MENVILTSNGFANPEYLIMTKKFFAGGLSGKKVAIVTTAAEKKERDEFALIAHAQFNGLGFDHVVFFDIEKQDPAALMDFDVVYVTGGNTYYLLYWTKKSGFDMVVRPFLEKGGLYIGVSAGSLIAGASIEVLNFTGGDQNLIGLKDYAAMKLTRKAIVPHYIESEEPEIMEYERVSGVNVIRLIDGAAMVGELRGKFHVVGYN